MDKRHRWSRQRWSKNGIHNNVAEGKNGILKRSFGSYVWINPKYSTLYLNEFSFLGNLRYFVLEDLLPEESLTKPRTEYQLDRNWDLRGLQKNLIHHKKSPLKDRLGPLEYEAKSLPEIKRAEQRSQKQVLENQLASVEDTELANTLRREYTKLQAWLKAKPSRDKRTKQRYYEVLAEKVWKAIPRHSYIELHDLARTARISAKHIFRLFGIWTKHGLLDSVDLNRQNKGKAVEYFDVRRNCEVLLPMRYTIEKSDIPRFNMQWRAKLRRFK
jgi:hypothetical protein